MRAVWVVETEAQEARWFIMSAHQHRADAWFALRKCRERWSDETFRVVKYVPAAKKGRAS